MEHYTLSNKKLWQWILFYVLIGGLIYAGVYYMYSYSQLEDTTYTSHPLSPLTVKDTNLSTPQNTTSPGTTTTAKLSYGDAVNLYQGKRIQFSDTCVAAPSTINLTKGTNIMLDNRSAKAKPIYLDGVRYDVGAYDYVVVTLTNTGKLARTIKVDCGTGKNNATIAVY